MLVNRLNLRKKLYQEGKEKMIAGARIQGEESLRKEKELKASAEISKIKELQTKEG